MQDVNAVTISGRLGAQPEVRYSPNGRAILNLRVAVGSRKKNGEAWEDHTDWIGVVAFGRGAEWCAENCDKGSRVVVQGRLQSREWVDRDGGKRTTIEVVADRLVYDRKPPLADAPSTRGLGGDDVPF